MAESLHDEREASAPLDGRILTIGRLRFAVGTMWLSWAKSSVSTAQAREWVASQKEMLPAFEALLIVARADNRTDIGLCAAYQSHVRALSQVVASHPEVFAPQLPSETYRWGVVAETDEGVYLAAASRDGLPLADVLTDSERLQTAKAGIEARFSDIHWEPPLRKEEFEGKILAIAAEEPTAVPKVSKAKLRIIQTVLLIAVAVGAVFFVRHYRELKAEQAALAASEAALHTRAVPSGFEARSALTGCLAAFQHTGTAAVGWSLVGGTCDTRAASFVWERGPQGLATTAPAGAGVSQDLRTAMLDEPLHITRCTPDQKARYASVEAAISDWAIAHDEQWRAGGGEHPTISIEGIIPGWEMPVETCVRTVSLRWSHTGTWRLDLGW